MKTTAAILIIILALIAFNEGIEGEGTDAIGARPVMYSYSSMEECTVDRRKHQFFVCRSTFLGMKVKEKRYSWGRLVNEINY